MKAAFFAPETYRDGNKLIKSLTKKKLLEQQGENVLIREGLEKALDIVLNSAHCMCFQNESLQKKEQTLSFYYADGWYTGMLQDRKHSLLVCTRDREAVYMAFEDRLEAKGISDSFQPEKWEKLYGEPIVKPVREAMVIHSGNRLRRNRLSLAMLSNKYRLFLLMGEDGQKHGELQRDTQAAENWFGVLLRELDRLKAEGDALEKNAPPKEEPPGPKSEYQRIVESKGFPKTGVGFWFWCLRNMILGIPSALKGAAKKKFLSFLACLAWAAALFFYNMYATCYLNDTFALERRGRWGNLTPYLMAGTLRTPSQFKGLREDWGQIDTAFLIWPLWMLLTLIGRHLILQIKSKKLAFLKNLAGIPRAVGECRQYGYGRGNQLWVPFLAAWILGFLIMNPVTLFLAAAYCLLIFAQKDNGLVRFLMLWRCAKDRKGVEAGTRQEPRTEKYRLLFFHLGCGFLLYALISLALWHVVGYHFWIRLIVTMLMSIFALLQIFLPGAWSELRKNRAARVLLLAVAGGMAAACFSARYGIVLADDGGWSESGQTLGGLLQNAGFSTILGLTLMTIGLALGGPVAWVAAGSALAAAGVFTIGCTDTPAGDYVKKTSRQYFFGAEDGENKTILCTVTELAGFAAGFMNPAVHAGGTAVKLFYAGKVAGDVVSMVGDSASTAKDIVDYANGSGDVGIGDLLWDALGLSLDICRFSDDVVEAGEIFQKINLDGDAYHFVKEAGFFQKYDQMISERDGKFADIRTDVGARRQSALDLEATRHHQKTADIQDSIRRLQNGELTPPMHVDSDTYLQELNRSLQTEEILHADAMTQIREEFGSEARKLEQEIQKKFVKESKQLLDEVTADAVGNGYDAKELLDALKEFVETNFPGNEE